MRFLHLIKPAIILAATFVLVSTCARAGADVSGTSARPSPDWLREGVIYEIFPRDFSSAGDLNGVTVQLDRLKDLGITILWIMPIHPIGEKNRKGELGSPYSITDYYAIDPAYGTPDDFKRLVSEAHKRGMKVIMDLVADHTAWDSVMMKDADFYKHDGQGRVIPPVPEWTDVAALNYANLQLREYMIAMLKYWIQTCDVDGFRCDAAAMVPTDFWVQVRAELARVKPDIMLLAEASKPELLTSAFDIDYDWPLLTTMNQIMMDSAPASDIEHTWEKSRSQFPKGALHMQISDDHDEARAVARYGLNGALAASALMFTLDGVPLIYNGMEVGDATESGGGALFDKLPIFWSPKDRQPLPDIYHGLIQLRHQYPALRNSNVQWLYNSDETRLLTFLRADDKDELLVVINFSNRPLSGKVDLKDVSGFVPVRISGVPNSDGGPLPTLHLNSFEWRIYHRSSILSHPVARLAADRD
ncbi:MAG: alpha-amylase family glycosyl hydrolase [Verrucomicrobiota bacterium]|jgi:glycosidase